MLRAKGEFESSWARFREAVNASVQEPEEYSGDIRLNLPTKLMIHPRFSPPIVNGTELYVLIRDLRMVTIEM